MPLPFLNPNEAPGGSGENCTKRSSVISIREGRPYQAREPELNLLLPEDVLEISLWKSLLTGITSSIFQPKELPLVLTTTPIQVGELLGDSLERPWYQSVFTNVRDALLPPEQPPLHLSSKPVEGQKEIFGVLTQPWFKSIVPNIRETVFPRRLPPLQLSSKPVVLPNLCGFYDHKKRAALLSAAVHALLIAVIVGGTIWAQHHRAGPPNVKAQVMPLFNDNDVLLLPPSKTEVGGGGGGGDRDVLEAPKGKLPKAAMKQFTPPIVVARNPNPKLPMEPTVVVPPQVKLPSGNFPNLGDPMAKVLSTLPSNGTGSGGGIGSGSGGGVGSGEGPGVGPGRGGGIGGGVFRVGGGVSVPRAIYSPEPEFSEEARRAKYQGIVTLQLVVAATGLPQDIRITRSLGMGLDEKAIEAVKRWRFEPAKKDGHPVAVLISVEVDFTLH